MLEKLLSSFGIIRGNRFQVCFHTAFTILETRTCSFVSAVSSQTPLEDFLRLFSNKG